MPTAHFVNFKQTGRVKEFERKRLERRALILYSIFGAANRLSKQKTALLFIFRQFQVTNVENSTGKKYRLKN